MVECQACQILAVTTNVAATSGGLDKFDLSGKSSVFLSIIALVVSILAFERAK
jgi:hypothetical protein